MARLTHPFLKPLRIVRSHPRLVIATALGIAVALALPHDLRLSTRLLAGWDVGAIFYLATAFRLAQDFDLKHTRRRAEQSDEGALLILVLTVAAAVASLAAIVVELGAARANAGDRLALALAGGTTLLSWALIHTMFAFHYAHRFYLRRGTHGSGLAFPNDDEPNYWDFIYFSFVIGMTFQVSDVQVTTKPMRRLVIMHGILSFFFSVAILALAVNVGASLI
jgi:uncharacterized membrane protein